MRTKASLHGRDRGFTLIEIMVVIAIIATLLGAGTLMIRIAQRKQMNSTTQGNLSAVGAALEQIRSQDQLGRYPPTDITKLVYPGLDLKKLGAQPNDTNIGIECLYVVFHMPGITVKPQSMDGEDKIGNTDDDKAAVAINADKPELFEYLDAWGHPLIYFSASDFKDPSKVERYVLKEGEQPKKVHPKKNSKNNEYIRSDSFQLMSLGADGEPDTDDDLMYGQ